MEPTDEPKSESRNPTTDNPTSTKTASYPQVLSLKERLIVPESLLNRRNWIVCAGGLSIIFIWLIAPSTPPQQPHIFSPELTLWLQARLGTEGVMAWFASIYYLIPMLSNVSLFFVVIYFAPRGKIGRASWIYGLAIIIGTLIDFSIYLVYPVAPPIRVPEHLSLGVVQIRMNHLPASEALISLKYSALPSGHIFYSVLGYLVCRAEGFIKSGYFYLTNTTIFSFIILYLGEHYWFDIPGSFLVAATAFYLTTRYLDAKYPPGTDYEYDNSVDKYSQ